MKEREFSSNIDKLLKKYKNIGMSSTSFKIHSKIDINESLKLVKVEWCFINKNRETILKFLTNYILNLNNQIKIIGVFEVNESAKVKKIT